jgi:hypothetical protein
MWIMTPTLRHRPKARHPRRPRRHCTRIVEHRLIVASFGRALCTSFHFQPLGPTSYARRGAHLAWSLLADLKKCQDVSVDQFLTGLLGFVREKGGTPALPEISLPDLILNVGVEVANLFCQVAGKTPSTAAASQAPSSRGKGYGYGLLQEL